jgi:DNA-binding MarR family transcriptional regulator
MWAVQGASAAAWQGNAGDNHHAGEDADDIGEIRDIVGFHLRLAHGAVYRHFYRNLCRTGDAETGLGDVAGDHPGIAQTGLAQRMRMDRATTMAIVNRLEARDLLQRGKSDTDGRKQTLNLTRMARRCWPRPKRPFARMRNG